MKTSRSSKCGNNQRAPVTLENLSAGESAFSVVWDTLNFLQEKTMDQIILNEIDKKFKPYAVKNYLQLTNVMLAITLIPYDKNQTPSYDGDSCEPCNMTDPFIP